MKLTAEAREFAVCWAETYRFARLADALTESGAFDSLGRRCVLTCADMSSPVAGPVYRLVVDPVYRLVVDAAKAPITELHDTGQRDRVQAALDAVAYGGTP